MAYDAAKWDKNSYTGDPLLEQPPSGSASDIGKGIKNFFANRTAPGGQAPGMGFSTETTPSPAPNNYGIRSGAANDTLAGMQTGTTPVATPTPRNPGSGFVVTADGRKAVDYGSPTSTEPNGSAFQQDYSYLQKPQAVQTQGIRPQVVQQAEPVKQSTMYAPDTSDQSFGGMFTQGLRMKQDRNYAAMNDAVTKNMLTGRAQDISAQASALSGANDAERNRLLGIRGEAQTQLDTAQAEGVNAETAQKQQAAGLFNKMNSETDPALQKKYADQYAMLRGQVKTQPQPIHGTETASDFTTRPYIITPDGQGGFRKVIPQQSIDERVTEAASGVSPKNLAKLQTKYKGQQASPAMLAELKALQGK